jgi:hypothetical protein
MVLADDPNDWHALRTSCSHSALHVRQAAHGTLHAQWAGGITEIALHVYADEHLHLALLRHSVRWRNSGSVS